MKKRARLTKRRRKSRRSKTRRRRGGYGGPQLTSTDVSLYNMRNAQNSRNKTYRPSTKEIENQRRRELEQERRHLNNEEGYDGMQIAKPFAGQQTMLKLGGKKKKRKRKRKKRKTKKR